MGRGSSINHVCKCSSIAPFHDTLAYDFCLQPHDNKSQIVQRTVTSASPQSKWIKWPCLLWIQDFDSLLDGRNVVLGWQSKRSGKTSKAFHPTLLLSKLVPVSLWSYSSVDCELEFSAVGPNKLSVSYGVLPFRRIWFIHSFYLLLWCNKIGVFSYVQMQWNLIWIFCGFPFLLLIWLFFFIEKRWIYKFYYYYLLDSFQSEVSM